mgnify:FL=1
MPFQTQQADNEHVRLLIAEYERLELVLLEMVAARLQKNTSAPDWVNQRLIEVQALKQAAAQQVTNLVKNNPQLVDRAIERAARDGMAGADSDADRADAKTGRILRNTGGTAVATDTRAIALLKYEANVAINTLNTGILRATEDMYRTVVAQTVATVISGVETRVQSTQRALDEYAKHGIKGFTDKGGRTWSMTAYAEMAMRTAATRALTQSHQDRLRDRGYDLVVISSHPRPAPTCQPYERQVLSLSGGNIGVVEVESALTGKMTRIRVKASLETATSRGLFHPNCRHTSNIWLPGVTDTTPTEPNDDGYEDTQKLRYLERQTRDWKRRSATALTPDAKKRADAKVREWQGKIRDHVDETGVGRRRDREQITGVYGPGNATRANASKTNVPKPLSNDSDATSPKPKPTTPAKPKPKPKPTLLSEPTRTLIEQARTTMPSDKAGWLDTTLKYPKDANGAKLVPEKLQRHLDTTLTVGKAIRGDAVKRFDTDPALKKLRKEDKELLASGGAFSPRRDAIFRDIARREQAILREALAEVRPIGGVKQAVKLSTTGLGNATAGTAEGIAAFRRAEVIYPADWLRAGTARGELDIGKADRAFFNETWDFIAAPETNKVPNYRGAFDSYPDEVMAHELGHRMETLIPGLTQLEFALLRSRSTKNGVLEPQTKVYPNQPELADEVGYEDDWYNRYAGKSYANDQMADPARRAAEIFQVGIQDTFGRSHPTGEFDKTSQLQEFVIGVMALL